jgi:hypothetical protein
MANFDGTGSRLSRLIYKAQPLSFLATARGTLSNLQDGSQTVEPYFCI